MPPPAEPSRWLDVLPPERAVFAAVDVQAAGGLLEGLTAQAELGEPRFAGLLNRVVRAYAAFDPAAQGAAPELDVVALGDFGPAALELRLSFERGWRKRILGEPPAGTSAADRGTSAADRGTSAADRGTSAAVRRGGPGEGHPDPDPWLPSRTYWEHSASALQLASPRRGVLLASTGGAARLLERAAAVPAASVPPVLLPADALGDFQGAELFVYLPSLPGGEAGLEISALPIRSIWLAARRDPAPAYRVAAVFALEPGSSERAVERLFRLLIPLLLRRAQVADPVGKFRGLTLSVGSGRVRIDNLRLSGEEMARFLADFLPQEFGPLGD